MGQAFDADGHVLAEAFGGTKKEVFDKLNEASPMADSMRIRTMRAEIMAMQEGDEGPPLYAGQPNAHVFPAPRDDGPCRETCKSMLESRILSLETKLGGLRHLLAIIQKIETGSPAEELIWSLLVKNRSAW